MKKNYLLIIFLLSALIIISACESTTNQQLQNLQNIENSGELKDTSKTGGGGALPKNYTNSTTNSTNVSFPPNLNNTNTTINVTHINITNSTVNTTINVTYINTTSNTTGNWSGGGNSSGNQTNTTINVHGYAYLMSNPTNAQVYINDSYQGNTTLNKTLYPGKYTLKFKKTGYTDLMANIQIYKGKTTTLLVNLTRLPKEETALVTESP